MILKWVSNEGLGLGLEYVNNAVSCYKEQHTRFGDWVGVGVRIRVRVWVRVRVGVGVRVSVRVMLL